MVVEMEVMIEATAEEEEMEWHQWKNTYSERMINQLPFDDLEKQANLFKKKGMHFL